MLKLLYFTKTLLLATSLLLFTGCGANSESETNTAVETSTDIATGTSNTIENNTNTGETNGETVISEIDDGNDNTSTTQTIILSSLKLSIDKTSLNKDESTGLKVIAIYSDNTSKNVTGKVEWIVSPKQSVSISNNTLKALEDTQVSIQARLDTKLSEKMNLNITWVVNDHTLPPEPDKVVNDATLLGVDVNGNGVRDDVERWIYEQYKDKHPIYIDIAMQAGRAYKLVLETPERAKEIRIKVNGALFCGWYYQNDAYRYNDPTLVHERIDTPVKSKYFNTKDRQNVYWQYDKLLSGGVYDLPRSKQMKALCDFNTSKYVE